MDLEPGRHSAFVLSLPTLHHGLFWLLVRISFTWLSLKSAFVFIRPALGIARRGTHCDSQSTKTLSVLSLLLSIPCRCIWRMCTALTQVPSHCQLPRAFPRGDPNWSVTGFLELSRALWSKAPSLPFLLLLLWGFMLIQFASFWELCKGLKPSFIIILYFIIYPKKPLGVSSCRLRFLMPSISCILSICCFKNWSEFAMYWYQQVRI